MFASRNAAAVGVIIAFVALVLLTTAPVVAQLTLDLSPQVASVVGAEGGTLTVTMAIPATRNEETGVITLNFSCGISTSTPAGVEAIGGTLSSFVAGDPTGFVPFVFQLRFPANTNSTRSSTSSL